MNLTNASERPDIAKNQIYEQSLSNPHPWSIQPVKQTNWSGSNCTPACNQPRAGLNMDKTKILGVPFTDMDQL